jgi:hypothetical protein
MDRLRRALTEFDAREAVETLRTEALQHPALAIAAVVAALLFFWFVADRRTLETRRQPWFSLWTMGAAGSFMLVVALAVFRA